MGPRYCSNMRAFKSLGRSTSNQQQYTKEEEGAIYGVFKLKRFQFKHYQEKEKFFPIRASQYRIFTGMNPTIKKQDLKFDGSFECGNLDLAVAISSVQYDLLMRVDSNTKGHTSWFFFKVFHFFPKRKVKFNIINFERKNLLYANGMKPYVFTSSKKQWCQDGYNVEFKPKRFRYGKQQSENQTIMGCLSFSYEFSQKDQYVYFAYCVPYSYSYLLHFLQNLKQSHPHKVSINMSHESMGGIPLPILTITNPTSSAKKTVCLCTGRLHPGQTQGSWVMEGFIRYICSPQGYYLREKVIFQIIPMVNVDGVVLGNFRTGIGGRDLNRVFDYPQKYNEISIIRKMAKDYKPLIYLDFHGHSAKKNVFVYGPNYSIDHRYFLVSRAFAKLIAKKTEAFRYYACIFKISDQKVNTGRAIMLKQHKVAFSFTIESSCYSFGPRQKEILFTTEQYINVGEKIADSLVNFLKIIFVLPKRLENTLQKYKELQKNKRQGEIGGKISKKIQMFSENEENELTNQEKQLITQLLQNSEEKQRQNEQNQLQSNEQGDSDFEQGNDYSDRQLLLFISPQSQVKDQSSENSSHLIKKKKRSRTKVKSLVNQSVTVLKNDLQQKQSDSFNFSKPPLIKIKNHKKQPNKIEKVKSVLLHRQINPILQDVGKEFQDFADKDPYFSNKVLYKNWSKNLDTNILQRNIIKLSQINQVSLNYSLSKVQSQYQSKRELERERSLKRSKQKEEKIKKLKKQKVRVLNRGNQSFQHSILPLLNMKNRHNKKFDDSEILRQILSDHQRSISKKKNFKILFD